MSARTAGYTLLEVLVVLVILAVTGAVAAPAFATLRPARDLDAATARVVAVLHAARTRALSGGVSSQAVFDPSRARVWLQPHDTSFALALPSACRLDGAVRTSARFAADGSARGDVPDVVCSGSRARITVDWLTGATTVQEPR